jgi:hypothetical protein
MPLLEVLSAKSGVFATLASRAITHRSGSSISPELFWTFVTPGLVLWAAFTVGFVIAFLRYRRWEKVVCDTNEINIVTLKHNHYPRYRILVTYTYSVNGATYESDKIFSFEHLYKQRQVFKLTLGEDGLKRFVERFQKSPIIYFNPERPAQSYILNGPVLIVWALPAIFIAFWLTVFAAGLLPVRFIF